jgi:hypothetical protein
MDQAIAMIANFVVKLLWPGSSRATLFFIPYGTQSTAYVDLPHGFFFGLPIFFRLSDASGAAGFHLTEVVQRRKFFLQGEFR